MMTGAETATAEAGEIPAAAVPPAAPKPPRKAKRHRTGLLGRLLLLALLAGLALAAVGLSGKAIPLPVWLVAEIETRLNRALAENLPDGAVALGAVDLTVDGHFMPRLALEDVRLLKAGGAALLTLPEVQLTLEGKALFSGEARITALRLIGAELHVARDVDGQLDISLGNGEFAPQIKSFADLFTATDRALSGPGLAQLATIEAEALAIHLTDQRSGRSFDLGDGRLTLENRADAVAAELAVSLQGGGSAGPGRAVVTLVSEKGAGQARVAATIDNVAAQDLAAQAALLAPLGILDAPISGRLAARLDATGITELEGTLEIAAGAIHPTEAAAPVAFDRASLAMRYIAAEGKVVLDRMAVESRTLRAEARGQSYLVAADGTRLTGPLTGVLPTAFLTQIRFEQVMIDPEGVFAEPVRFSSGALDLRFGLNPFLVEIGQLSLAEETRRLTVTGRLGADAAGWTAAVDVALNEVAHDRLIALWPKALLPKTREWLGKNLLKANLFDVKAALRIAPDQEPRLHLGYSFSDADVRFLATLPPIRNGVGYSTIDGQSYTMVMSAGQVTAPLGGDIDVRGSVFKVPDIRAKPARAEITLKTASSLTAALSLLDLPPFNFMTKADRPVDLGEGEAEIETRLTLPLQKKIALQDVDYDVSGIVRAFRSTKLVPQRAVQSEVLAVSATPEGLSITGPGHLGAVPFDVTFTQGFGPAQRGKARIEGEIVLSQDVAEEFGLGLPKGMVSGKGAAAVEIDLVKGQPGQLALTSALSGIGLSIPELGWSKPAAGSGRLAARVTLGAVPKVEDLTLEAAGLTARGRVTMRKGGGLDLARFDSVTLDDWLDGTVEITGRGADRPVGLAMTGGQVDMRRMPGPESRRSSKSGQGSGPLSLRLDRLIVTDGIALRDFNGDFSLRGGLNGTFIGRVNDGPAVTGTVVPAKHGTAVRVQSDNAGATMAAAGLYSSARGGSLDLTLTPRPESGTYDGRFAARGLRVRNASTLAELLNAISVVGLLEQLNGQGLVFNEVDGSFLLTPKAVELRRGTAIGASLGVTMEGVYVSGSGKLAMQGVVSPVYLLNGIGAAVTRRGEGVFGFNYTLRGTADDPSVEVNPLSILTPGMFREIFRGKAPVLGGEADPTAKDKE
jgi:Protein of unknown function